MAAAIPIALGIAQIAGTGYSIYSAEQQKKEAKIAAGDQERKQNALLDQARQREQIDKATKERDMQRARGRQDQLSKQSANKGGTVLSYNPMTAFAPLGGTGMLGG